MNELLVPMRLYALRATTTIMTTNTSDVVVARKEERTLLREVPWEVIVEHVARCLGTRELVLGLGMTCSGLRKALRAGAGVRVELGMGRETLPEWRTVAVKAAGESWQRIRSISPEFVAVLMKSMPREAGCSASSSGFYCSSLRELVLDFSDVTGTEFRELVNLELLSLRGCLWVKKLTASCLPPKLRTLDLYWCRGVDDVSELPDTLQTLNLSVCVGIRDVSRLPKYLDQLCLFSCRRIHDVSNLPRFLSSLNISYCTSIRDLTQLPPELHDLDVSGCTSISSIFGLPLTLNRLKMHECTGLHDLGDLNYLVSLRELDLSECINIRCVSSLLPKQLRVLILFGCSDIQDVNDLPESLETLDLSHCVSVRDVSRIPKGLKEVNLFGCLNLET